MRAKPFHELTAGDVLTRGAVVIPKQMTLRGAARLMAEGRVGAAPVTDARGRCVGLLLATDVVRWAADAGRAGPGAAPVWSEWQVVPPGPGGGDEVRRHMIPDPVTVAPDTPLPEVARLVLADRARRAVVIDRDHRPLGILSAADVLAAALAADRRPGGHGRPARTAASARAALRV